MPPEGWGKQYLKVALFLLAAAFAQNMLQLAKGKRIPPCGGFVLKINLTYVIKWRLI